MSALGIGAVIEEDAMLSALAQELTEPFQKPENLGQSRWVIVNMELSVDLEEAYETVHSVLSPFLRSDLEAVICTSVNGMPDECRYLYCVQEL